MLISGAFFSITSQQQYKKAIMENVPNKDVSLIIFPNPVKNELNIKDYIFDKMEYSITSQSGEIIMVGKIQFGDKIIVNKLHSGVYLVHFIDKSKEFSLKFIKE